MTGPESVVLPLHHTPMSAPHFRNAVAKVLLFSECAKKLATFFASDVNFVSFSLVLELERRDFW